MKAAILPRRVILPLLLALITTLAIPALVGAAPQYIYVDDDSSGNGTLMNPYKTIQEALSAATAGVETIISVAEGTYTGSYTLRNKVSLAGAGAEKPYCRAMQLAAFYIAGAWPQASQYLLSRAALVLITIMYGRIAPTISIVIKIPKTYRIF